MFFLILPVWAVLSLGTETALAKSLYVIAGINDNPPYVKTYDLVGSPAYMVYQASREIPDRSSGPVGLAIDTNNAKLFVTYEGSNVIQIIDAVTFKDLGTTTAPNAANLAGIALDAGKRRMYTIDRNTNKLYVYDWNSSSNTLTLVSGAPFSLASVTSAYGLALDESRGRLYIGDANSTTLRYFRTDTWAEAGNFTLAKSGQTPEGIAVDTVRNIVYSGNLMTGNKRMLVKYDLNTNSESSYTLPVSTDSVVGVAVDEDTGYVYTTVGCNNCSSSATVLAFDSNLNVLKNNLGQIGRGPTGITIPRAAISYNPLSFTKTGPTSASANSVIDYSLCYDNAANTTGVSNVTIVDTLPSGLAYNSSSPSGTYNSSAGTVTWNIGSLAAGARQSCVKLTVTVTASSGSVVNRAVINSTETGQTTQTVTTAIGSGGGPGACDYLKQDFSGSPGTAWGHLDGTTGPAATWTWLNGKLDVDQIQSGKTSWYGTDITTPDLFTADVDVEIVAQQGGFGMELFSWTTYPFVIDGKNLDGIGPRVSSLGDVYLTGWDSSGQWLSATSYKPTATITSIGVQVTATAAILRVNKTNTGVQATGSFASAIRQIGGLAFFASATGTHIRFDNLCVSSQGGSSTTTTTTTTTTRPSTTTTTTTLPSGGTTITVDCPPNAAVGSQVTVPIRITSTTSVAGFQVELLFNTSQLTYVSVAKGASAVSSGKDIQKMDITSGRIRFLVQGSNQTPIPDGVIMNVTFQIASGLASGTQISIGCDNLYASNPSGSLVPAACARSACAITVTGKCGCDVDKDGRILVNDSQLLVNMILGVIPATCDVNGDGTVNVLDLQIVINAVLDPQNTCRN